MKYLDKFELFLEALKPSMFRRYVKEFVKERYADIFKQYKNKYDGDKNAYRLYLPLVQEYDKELDDTNDMDEIEVGETEENIVNFLRNNDLAEIDYMEGKCKYRGAKNTVKIGQTLTKISNDQSKDEETRNQAKEYFKLFVEDPARKVAKNEELMACISRHPYDIAGSDTDRAWKDCMTLPHDRGKTKDNAAEIKNLKHEKEILEIRIKEIDKYQRHHNTDPSKYEYFGITEDELYKMRNDDDDLDRKISTLEKEMGDRQQAGSNAHYLIYDIKEGSLIAYLIKKSDKNIKNPIACLNIKPYINEEDPKDIILSSDCKTYSTNPIKGNFKATVDKFLAEINGEKEGEYHLNPKLYVDQTPSVIFKMNPEKAKERLENSKDIDSFKELWSKIENNDQLRDKVTLTWDIFRKVLMRTTFYEIFDNESYVKNRIREIIGENRYEDEKTNAKFEKLLLKKLEESSADDVPMSTYNRLRNQRNEEINTILNSDKFEHFTFYNKLKEMENSNQAHEFVAMLINDPSIVKKFDFLKLAKGKLIYTSPDGTTKDYQHSVKTKDFPSAFKHVYWRTRTDHYPFWLCGTYSNSEITFIFKIDDEGDIEFLKKLLRKPRVVKPKAPKDETDEQRKAREDEEETDRGVQDEETQEGEE